MTRKLATIAVSTRPGRVGIHVARWMQGVAEAHGGFDSTLVDLAELALPIYDEPKHPRLRKYQHEHTKRWSAIVDAADAYVLVMPEYNFSVAPALANALDYVFSEWACKPAGFVSYGGVSGGLLEIEFGVFEFAYAYDQGPFVARRGLCPGGQACTCLGAHQQEYSRGCEG